MMPVDPRDAWVRAYLGDVHECPARGLAYPILKAVIISAQKANAANGLSLDALALSTANLYSHNIAWKVRHLLELDYVASGVDP
jgi:hypothetical protein